MKYLNDLVKEKIKQHIPVEPVMHTKACKNCPSAHFEPDPEALDIMSLPHADRVKTAFPCGWNGKKYCKGYCDSMGITNEDLIKLHENK